MNRNVIFKDRLDAGGQLARLLIGYKGKDVVVFALTRGGVPVGKQVALALNCPLEALVIKKIGHPSNPEYAVGAVSDDGFIVLNTNETDYLDKAWLENEIKIQKDAAVKKRKFLMGDAKSFDTKGKIAIIVDDGIATGLTIFAAIKKIRGKEPREIIVAVPVAPKEEAAKIRKEADDFIAVEISEDFLGAVGAYYQDFTQVSDEQALEILRQ
jgi:predicted phosphoribosyltransferase